MFFNKLFGKYKFITMSVILAVLTACLVAVIVHFYLPKENSETDTSLNSNQVSHDSLNGALSGDSCFLVVCNDNDSSDILFMFLADFRIYSSSIVITPLSADTVSADGRSYDAIYSYGGINMLKSSIESMRNITVDRYAILNRSGLSSLTDLMGEVELYVEEDYTYQSSDKSYEVKTGENEMGSDMLFTYLMLHFQRNSAETSSALIRDIINVYLSTVEPDEIEDLFLSLTNCFDTDVSIADYYSAKSDIEYLVGHDVKCVLANDVDN